MTFKEIEKEFDEQFNNINIAIVTIESTEGTVSQQPAQNRVKSFLKQSFIKYLQENIEFIDDRVREEIKLETVEMCDVYLGKLYAYDEIKKSLQAQIKEIETCK